MFNQLYEVYITSLVINRLGRGHTHTHTLTHTHTDNPHRINFKKPGAPAWPACAWFKKFFCRLNQAYVNTIYKEACASEPVLWHMRVKGLSLYTPILAAVFAHWHTMCITCKGIKIFWYFLSYCFYLCNSIIFVKCAQISVYAGRLDHVYYGHIKTNSKCPGYQGLMPWLPNSTKVQW